jgi:hypothetical protein
MYNVYWLPDGCCLWSRGSKYLEYNSSIRIKNKLNNQTKALNRSKRNRVNKSWTIKLGIDDTGTDWLSVLKKGWIVTVQYLQGLIIFVITELAIATLFACVLVHEASEVVLPNSMFFQQAHLGPSEKTSDLTEPFVASCLTSRAVSVEFHNCNDSVTRVARRLWVPTMHSNDNPASRKKGGSS